MDFIAQLIEEREILLKRLKGVTAVLQSYGHEFPEAILKASESEDNTPKRGKRFPKGGTYLEQVSFIFETEKRFLHTKEVAKIIADKDGIEYNRWLIRRVSAVMSKTKREGDIEGFTSYQFGKQTKDNVWGLKDWFDANGNIVPKYAYKDKDSLGLEVKK